MKQRPWYADLQSRPPYPDYSSWGLWGAEDEVGAINDLQERDVAAAARLVTSGAVFPLNWRLDLPDPPFFGRSPYGHVIHESQYGMDDHLDCFWPQISTQWDSLSHFRHPQHGYYGGRGPESIRPPSSKNGIDKWATRGIAGRFLLADVARWRASVGRPVDMTSAEALPASDIEATLEHQGSALLSGDVLLLRFGWISWYEQLDLESRHRLADSGPAAPGLASSEETVSWLWDAGVMAVASDNPAVEAHPFDPGGFSLHANLLALLGVPLGELWALDRLADDCALDGRYSGLLVSAPLNLPGGIGSPANAVALK